jgi:hypothetical protein
LGLGGIQEVGGLDSILEFTKILDIENSIMQSIAIGGSDDDEF